MDFKMLNPLIKNVALYEKAQRGETCISYCSKIIYLISGELSYSVGEGLGNSPLSKKIRLSPGSLLFIPEGTAYLLKSKYMRAVIISFDLIADEKSDAEPLPPVRLADFSPELLHRQYSCEPFDKVICIDDFESERDTFISMNHIFTSSEGNYLAEISAMLKLLLLKICNLTDENALPSAMVKNLDGYIRENIRDEISNTELGAIFGYHPFYISRMLKSKKGITLHQYVMSYRIKYAKRLLECTDKTIAEIADETGFTDASYFTKIFKSEFSVTPKEYRNKFKDTLI